MGEWNDESSLGVLETSDDEAKTKPGNPQAHSLQMAEPHAWGNLENMARADCGSKAPQQSHEQNCVPLA